MLQVRLLYDNGTHDVIIFKSLPPNMLITRTVYISPGIVALTLRFHAINGILFIKHVDCTEYCNGPGNANEAYNEIPIG